MEISERIARELLSKADCLSCALIDDDNVREIAAIIRHLQSQWQPKSHDVDCPMWMLECKCPRAAATDDEPLDAERLAVKAFIREVANEGCLRGRRVHCAEREPNSSDWCVACKAKYLFMEKK